MLEKYAGNKEMEGKNVYKEVLSNLKNTVSKIYDKDFIQKCKKDDVYYKIVEKYFSNSNIITTNYTPFVKITGKGDDKIAYLAGKLSQFENPKTFEIKDLELEELGDNEYVFPFLMTQAYIKPIVSRTQIDEYSKAIGFLKETNLLVVIGYSLCENDNHINAIINDYIKKAGHKMLYLKYVDDKNEFDE